MRETIEIVKIYPRINNNDLLEFSIPESHKGHLDLSNVLLNFKVTLPIPSGTSSPASDVVLPQNFLGPKQFSSVEVRINGQTISRKSCQNEYFLNSYFQHKVNYGSSYSRSGCRTVGIYDQYNFTTSEISRLSAPAKTKVEDGRTNLRRNLRKFEIVMPIDSSIFYTNDVLPTRTALDLSFERLGTKYSAVLTDGTNAAKMPNDYISELEDCFLEVPYVRDSQISQNERGIMNKPLKIHYDDYVIKRNNIQTGTNSISLPNIINGRLPSLILWGIQSMDSYNGSYQSSSTRFNRYGMNKANILLNGMSVSGFPLTMSSNFVSRPFVKFLQNTNKQMNANLGSTMILSEFHAFNFLLSAKFNSEDTGTISFQFDFDEDIEEDLVLITCCIYEKTMKIDQYRNFEIQPK